MGTQAGFDPNAFGPFGAIFQNYFSMFDTFNPSLQANAVASSFDPQALTGQAMAPLKAAARCQIETLGLMNRRTQAYMQVPTRLALCRTPQDVLNEQMAFWRTASEQYRETSLKIGEAWMQAFSLAAPVRAGVSTERDYISFNGSGSKDGAVSHSTRQEPSSGKQRRVA